MTEKNKGTGEVPPENRTRIPATVISIAALMAGVLFASAWNYGPFGDEFYYIDCGRHLDAGYVDHPPLAAFAAFAIRTLFGTSYIALRAVSALAAGAAVLLAALIAARLGGGRFAQSMAALAIAAAPGFWAIFSFYSMNAFDIVIVSIAVIILIDILEKGAQRRWVAFGVCVGIGLLNKLTLLPLGCALLAGILATKNRTKLLTPWPWIAGAIAGLIFLPHIVWQMAHGWPTIEFVRLTQQYSINPLSVGGYLLQLALTMNPLLAPVWIAGLLYLLRDRPPHTGRVLGILAVFFIALYAAQRSKMYYVYPIMPLLMAGGAVALEQFVVLTARTWIRSVSTALIGISGLALLPLGAPVLPIELFIPYGKATGLMDDLKIHRNDPINLPVHFALRFGWKEMVESVSQAYDSLSEEERVRCVVVANDYAKAGAVNYYRSEYGLPEAISGHNSYRYWLPEDLQAVAAIAVGFEEEYLRRYFRDVELFGVHHHPYAAPWETDQEIFIARDPTRPWEQIRREMHWY
jgi:4-amino-4-deoxy-L-arabinose transferase-like glycosyltransferase